MAYRTILLKTPTPPSDPYAAVLPNCQFLPVLDHVILPEAQSQLTSLLLADPPFPCGDSSYGGLIFTSARSVAALSQALSGLRGHSDYAQVKERLAKCKLVLYVVGKATGRALREATSEVLPQTWIEGEGSGSGEKLADLIVNSYEQGRRALLFFVGEQRRDIIPKTLMSENLPAEKRIRVDELVVYETAERQKFAEEFAETLGEDEKWIVVFSPTGCAATLRMLGWLDEHDRFAGRPTHSNTRIASIGPTTQEYLSRTFGFDVDVCADEPTPEGVKKGIDEFK